MGHGYPISSAKPCGGLDKKFDVDKIGSGTYDVYIESNERRHMNDDPRITLTPDHIDTLNRLLNDTAESCVTIENTNLDDTIAARIADNVFLVRRTEYIELPPTS